MSDVQEEDADGIRHGSQDSQSDRRAELEERWKECAEGYFGVWSEPESWLRLGEHQQWVFQKDTASFTFRERRQDIHLRGIMHWHIQENKLKKVVPVAKQGYGTETRYMCISCQKVMPKGITMSMKLALSGLAGDKDEPNPDA